VSSSSELDALLGTAHTKIVEITTAEKWSTVCTCGHLDRYHSESTGGTAARPLRLPERVTWTFHGCRGAIPYRGFKDREPVPQEDGPPIVREQPTCPREEFRPVAKVDRAGRYFNQKIPRDREDPARHPFVTGMRAHRTRISKLKSVAGDPAKRDREFDRRFTWLPDARVCSISSCTETADVWPVFVDADDRSELRCPKHR